MGTKKQVKHLSFLSLLSVAVLSQLLVDDGSLSFTTKTVKAEDTLTATTPLVTAPETTTVSETNKTVEPTVTSRVLETPKATFSVAAPVVVQPSTELSTPVTLAATADEPPADEDVPDLNEQNLINQVNQQLDDIQLFLDEGDVAYAKQLFDDAAADFAAVNNIVNMKASKATLLEKIEKYRALVNGGSTTPVTVTKTEVIAVTKVYEADPSLAYGQQTTKIGTAGEQSYTETNGVRDAGSEKLITAMVPTVIKVGTMPKEEVVAIPASTTVVYEDDPTLEIGQTKLKTAAVAGSKTVVTSYQLKDATSAEVITTSSEKDIVAGQEAVYLRGTKQPDVVPVTVTKTEAIAVTTVYEADPSLAYGQQITQTGTAGEQSYTETNGVRDVGSEKLITAMVPTVIKVGTMPKEEVVAIPASTTVVYEDDPTLEIGQTKLKTAAEAGSKTVVTSYQLKDASSVEVITTSSEKDIVAGQEAVYLRGTKQPDVVTVVSEEIVTEAIDYSSIVVENSNLEKGKENQLQVGKQGVIKRVYTVITVNGVEISRELISEELIEAPTSEIIEVGTMEKPTPSNPVKNTPISNQTQLDTPKQKQDVKQVVTKEELPRTGDSNQLLELSGLMLLGMLATVAKVFKKRF
ncbi:G5 domain-containing protein [Streptococcus iniae]|uniref:G5 domain-containing protein n=1 Tax=Streptococcus iniae TaxID=1346 RepID=UPI000EF7219B|nr:G5 domain-containing protein [Streptococcus iniae]RLV05194.1 cell wall protein [Streptococcus iniae]RLV15638.1 cell wall protein [Streptococcus iniae]RLV36264.1 cell wall protein [Streptococcus iniae]RMI50025.1 cell wall protein [Streptococcus iniae]